MNYYFRKLKWILWRIKHWFKYEPSIYFNFFLSKFFRVLYEINDRLGYFLFGKEKWEKLKREEGFS